MNYIGEKVVLDNYFYLHSITFVMYVLLYLFISGYQQYFSMLILEGSGDHGYIFAPRFNFELKFKKNPLIQPVSKI